MKRLIQSDSNNMMPTKDSMFQRVDNLVKKYGRRAASIELRNAFLASGDWYQEDRRQSGVDFAKQVIDNFYTDNIPNYYDNMYFDGLLELYENNTDVTVALDEAERWLSRRHQP